MLPHRRRVVEARLENLSRCFVFLFRFFFRWLNRNVIDRSRMRNGDLYRNSLFRERRRGRVVRNDRRAANGFPCCRWNGDHLANHH